MTKFSEEIASVTVHGLPRAVNAKSRSLRFLWTALLLCTTVTFSYHLSQLICRYRDRPVSTKMSLRAVDFRFPNLYICSPFIFSASRYNESLHNGFVDRLRELVSKTFAALAAVEQLLGNDSRWDIITGGQSVYMEKLYSSGQFSTYTYDQFFGRQDKYQIIIKAMINDEELSLNAFRMVPNFEFLSCIQFLNSSRLTSPDSKLTLYLYNDAVKIEEKRFPSKRTYKKMLDRITYSGDSVDEKSNNFLLYFEEDGHYPSKYSEQLSVTPGFLTKISVSMTARSMMSSPDDTCVQDLSTVDVVSHLDSNVIVTYKVDHFMCQLWKWALEFHERCGCVPHQYPIPVEIFRNTARCLNVSHWSPEKVVKGIHCVVDLMKDEQLETRIKQRCAREVPCNALTYDYRWSMSTWPMPDLMDSFLNDVMKPIFDQRNRDNHSVPGWRNILHAPTYDDRIRMAREDILKVEIWPKEDRSTWVTENTAYPAMNLFSDIGGILGLYIGMSLLSVIELFQTVLWATQTKVFRFFRSKSPDAARVSA